MEISGNTTQISGKATQSYLCEIVSVLFSVLVSFGSVNQELKHSLSRIAFKNSWII